MGAAPRGLLGLARGFLGLAGIARMRRLAGIARMRRLAGIARMRRLLAIIAIAALGAGPVRAQLALPGASLTPPAPAKADGKAPRRRHSRRAETARVEADPATLVDKPLKLNGRNGELELTRGDDKALKIVKYVMLGEVVSNPTQQCRIDIVAQTPIEAIPQGEPDGLPRYSAAIPACPLSFDVVDGAVLVPAQTDACVFAAADCRASPSGLWGPDAAELDKEPKAISKLRTIADRSIKESQRALERRDKDAAASLAREGSDFSATRDDVCHDYVAESRLGFCASRLAQTRAALLAKRVAETDASEPKDKERKSNERKRKRRKKKAGEE
jgi:hypothetical protein